MKPSRWLVCLAGAWLAMTAIGLWIPLMVDLSLPVGLGLLVLVLVDVGLFFTQKSPRLDRELPGIVNRDQPFAIRLILHGLPRSRTLLIHDGLPEGFTSPQQPITIAGQVRQPGNQALVLNYHATASQRGQYDFSRAWCQYRSRLGFWWRLSRCGPQQSIKVFPPFWRDERARLALMAGNTQAGAFHSFRRRGLGTEFHQLREYRHGDPVRNLDWKATGRLHKPVIREYQEEQNQEIIFVLDTGYRMHASENGVSHFDRALESLLLLARVALKQGDSVGVMTFGPHQQWISPVKGVSAMNLLLPRLFDLQSQAEASSPSAALETLLGRLRRRSLIVLMTNVREEDGAGMGPYLPQLLARHLLLTIWLREEVVDSILSPPFTGHKACLDAAAARLYLDDRAAIQKDWIHQGVMLIDTTPAKLNAQLVNKYWEIKKGGRL